MRIKILLLFGVVLVPIVGLAGWFDLDNYEDCVLEKMKGQQKHLLNIARKACRNEFPEKITRKNMWDGYDLSDEYAVPEKNMRGGNPSGNPPPKNN